MGFPAGDGLAHTIFINTDAEMHLLVAGEASRADNKFIYPLHPEMATNRTDWWHDAPKRAIGPHEGLPDAGRPKKN